MTPEEPKPTLSDEENLDINIQGLARAILTGKPHQGLDTIDYIGRVLNNPAWKAYSAQSKAKSASWYANAARLLDWRREAFFEFLGVPISAYRAG